MELIEINGLDTQSPQRRLKLFANIGRREAFGPVQELIEAVAELGGDDPLRAVVPAQVITDQALGKVVPVALSGVDEVDAELRGLIENGVRVGLGKRAAPLAAKLPGTDADDRYPQPCAAENSVTHAESLLQNPVSGTRIVSGWRRWSKRRSSEKSSRQALYLSRRRRPPGWKSAVENWRPATTLRSNNATYIRDHFTPYKPRYHCRRPSPAILTGVADL